jgi:hypothetical protein
MLRGQLEMIYVILFAIVKGDPVYAEKYPQNAPWIG